MEYTKNVHALKIHIMDYLNCLHDCYFPLIKRKTIFFASFNFTAINIIMIISITILIIRVFLISDQRNRLRKLEYDVNFFERVHMTI